MKLTILDRNLLVVIMLIFGGVCHGSESAVVIIYQPIITESEADPKGFKIMPIPFWWFHTAATDPFFAITQANQLLTDAPPSEVRDDRNLLSSAGVLIGSTEEDGPVYVRFENLKRPLLASEEITDDDIAEAALECVRRVAHERKARPKIVLSGESEDEAKWKKWQKHFEQHNLAKPFTRPKDSRN